MGERDSKTEKLKKARGCQTFLSVFTRLWQSWEVSFDQVSFDQVSVYQSVSKLLQYHGGSPEKPRVLILAPTGVASININGTAIHSAFG